MKRLTQREFTEKDTEGAKRLAKLLGYDQHAYTSTSGLIGLFCMVSGDQYRRGKRGGCIIATEEFGLMFVQDVEDITGEMEI